MTCSAKRHSMPFDDPVFTASVLLLEESSITTPSLFIPQKQQTGAVINK